MKTFQWISVKDALPTPETDVLVLPTCGSVCYGFSKDGKLGWVRDYDDGYQGYREPHYEEITHWMYDPRGFPPEQV